MRKKREEEIKRNTFEGIVFPELTKGTLVKRYKRFLADVKLDSGEVITAHCPNSGSMTACSNPGATVYLSYHDTPTRKLKYGWELIEMPTSMVGVNTLVPNRLVYQTIKADQISELSGYDYICSEVKVNEKSRLDIELFNKNGERCFIEIKNCTLVEDGKASFPDAVTSRGLKHLKELQALKDEKTRAVIFFLIQRMDAKVFSPADIIDPAYGKELRASVENGVEILVYDVDINAERVILNAPIPFFL